MSQRTLNRRADIKRALARAKRGVTEIDLDALAAVWGVSKARFITVRNSMVGFPAHLRLDGGAHVYPAEAALKAMWDHETRNDVQVRERAQRNARLLGGGKGRPSKAELEQPIFTPSELLKYSQLQAITDEREIEQGRLVRADEIAAIAAEVFSLLSSSIGSLATTCDPNGLWTADVRASVDAAGRSELLRLHGEMKKLLTPRTNERQRRQSSRA